MEKLDDVLTGVVGDGKLLTVQPGGNHGDSLIYHGFENYLEATDIEQVRLDTGRFRYDAPRNSLSMDIRSNLEWAYKQWKYARHQMLDDISAVYIHGGGNFNDMWEVGIKCYETIARYFDCPIIVGPQSCQFEASDPTEIFEGVSNETHFFCREEYSYEIMREAASDVGHVDVYIDTDTALLVDAEDLPPHRLRDEYTLLAMRMDQDSTIPLIESEIRQPVKVNDISKMEPTYGEWVNVAAGASRIYTDRLHVAILGHILGKPITWYNTGYHKNRGVYEYSLADEPNIEFITPTASSEPVASD